jgi:fructose-1,6-bisphosphatase II
MIGDGDIAAALAPALSTSNIDLYAGIGGSPEGVLSAAALRCLGGGMQVQIWPRDEQEKKDLIANGWGDRLDKVYLSRDLARGPGILFCATGISDSPLLDGMQVHGSTVTTHSIMMRVKTGTVRFVHAHHNLNLKTIRLRSTQAEVEI